MKPKLAVWKFSSCDGCQLSMLDCEDELLALAAEVQIAYFLEATSSFVPGPYDVSLVEGSISTPHEEAMIRKVREQSKFLVTIGACATSGGIQALRNFADVEEYISVVYAHREYIDTLEHVHPVSDYVKVDFELRGCPVNKYQLLELLNALLNERKPNIPPHSLCMECKKKGIVCVSVAHGTPCIGPVTHAGCGVLCPSYNRGCYGCFGPMETPNTEALAARLKNQGMNDSEILRVFRNFNANAPEFREESLRHE